MQFNVMYVIEMYQWKGGCVSYVMCCVNATMLNLLGLTMAFEVWLAKQEAIQTDRYAKLLIFLRCLKVFWGSEGKQEAILTDRYANPLISLGFSWFFWGAKGKQEVIQAPGACTV